MPECARNSKRIVKMRQMLIVLLAAVMAPAYADNPFKEILRGVKSTLAGTNVIIGTVEVQSPFVGIVTCFKDSPGAAISRQPIQTITQAEGFPSLIMTRTGVLASGQCSELQAKGLLVAPAGGAGGGGSAGRPANFKAITDTELYNIFERFPQPGGGKWADWPRVAVTLLEAPPWGKDKQNVHRFKFPSMGCWTYKARVWESASKSRDIPAFHYCTDQKLTVHGGDNSMIYQVWGGIVGGSSAMNQRGSTGIQRTEGPNWPDTPLPVGTRAGFAFVNQATFNGTMLYMLAYDLGINFNNEDHRLWINVADSLLAQSADAPPR
jgi:hypothetical protein